MRALSATLLAAAACLGAAAPAVTLVPPVKPTLNAAAPPSIDFVEPPANLTLNSRDVPITIGFKGAPDGAEVGAAGGGKGTRGCRGAGVGLEGRLAAGSTDGRAGPLTTQAPTHPPFIHPFTLPFL